VKKYDLIIFDCDGTIVDSEPLTNRIIAGMIQEYGIDTTPEECLAMFAGKTIGHITDFIKSHDKEIDTTEFERVYRLRCNDLFLPAAGLDNYFKDRIYSAYDVQAWKPKPDLFLHVCKDRNCEPARALVIEDSWSGAMGAINGGIDVVVYNPHGDVSTFTHGVPNFSTLSSIRQFISRYL